MCYKTFISGVISRHLAWGCFRPGRPEALGLTWNVGTELKEMGLELGVSGSVTGPPTPTPWCSHISYLGSGLVSLAA